jgi:hypothetical protein
MLYRTVWLVDIGFVVKVGSQRFKLDYIATEKWLNDRFGPVTTFLFNGYDPTYGIPDGLNRFYTAMRSAGMTVCLHPMSGRAGFGDHRQRRVDVDMTAHLVWQASLPDVERVVLTTGDQDFLPAVHIVREQCRKQVVLLCYDQDVSADLKQVSDELLFLDDIRTEVIRAVPGEKDPIQRESSPESYPTTVTRTP